MQIVYLPDAIGQRAAINLGARISTARYVMKLDAHCSVSPGFDVELLAAAEQLGDDCTQIPAQKNLHVFNWKCLECGHETYQGPDPTECVKCKTPFMWQCADCGHEMRTLPDKGECAACKSSSLDKKKRTRVVVWQPRGGTTTVGWRLDTDLRFGYWNDYKRRPECRGDIHDVMTSLGACFFMSRDRFWKLGGLDEAHGSWGQFGAEIALKSWLSGGRHVVNKKTWYAHLFRTQKGFGFPWEWSGDQAEHARAYSREMWMNNRWPGQVRPLRWLVEKFSPVPGWTKEQIDALPASLPSRSTSVVTKAPTKGIVYYSDCRPDAAIMDASRRTIEASGLPIVAVTLQPVDWPAAKNIVLPLERAILTMFRQILAGLEALDTDYVFMAEHDVLYAPEHWTFTPPRDDCYFYDIATWKVDASTGRAVTYETKQTSGLCANRLLLIEHYRKRIAIVECEGFSRRQGFEPGSHRRAERVDDVPSDVWRSAVPNVDIRHDRNLTPSRWSQSEFRDQRHCRGWQEADEIPGWGRTRCRFREWLSEVVGIRVAA